MILLSDEEIVWLWDAVDRGRNYEEAIAKAQLKKVVEWLEDALENSFVMAYVGEDSPYEPTIDPITIREMIESLKEEIKE